MQQTSYAGTKTALPMTTIGAVETSVTAALTSALLAISSNLAQTPFLAQIVQILLVPTLI
jgi:hypothetical protein